MQSGLYAARDLSAGVTQPIHRNTSGDWQVVAVNFCNRNTATVATVAIAIVEGVDPTPADWDYIEWGSAVIGNGSFDRTQIMLPANSWVVVTTDLDNVSCQVMGWGNTDFEPAEIDDTVPDGLTALTAAPSAAAIQAATGTTTDGVYWIKPSPQSPAQEVYCIMDPTWDGGGWMIVANNAAVDRVYQSSHQPRLTGRPEYVGSSGADSYDLNNNFSINVWGMPISEVAWCARASADYKDVYTYSYGTFDTATYIPDTTVYTRLFDNYHQTLPWLAGFDVRLRPTWNVVPTNSTNSFSLIALHAGNAGYTTTLSSMSYNPVQVLGANANNAVYPVSTNNTNAFGISLLVSWADRQQAGSEGSNSLYGLDDWQDGLGCSDLWGIASGANYGRGLPSYIMVR